MHIVSVATAETIDFLIERTNRLSVIPFRILHLSHIERIYACVCVCESQKWNYNLPHWLWLCMSFVCEHGMKQKPKHTNTHTFSSKTLRWRPILNRNEAVFAKGKTYVHKAREQTEWNATKLNVICMQNSTEFMSLPLSPAVFCEMRWRYESYLYREPNWFWVFVFANIQHWRI